MIFHDVGCLDCGSQDGEASDTMAESIIGMIRDGFLAVDGSRMDRFDLSDERLSGIMRELEVDRDRITRILSVLEDERTKLQKR